MTLGPVMAVVCLSQAALGLVQLDTSAFPRVTLSLDQSLPADVPAEDGTPVAPVADAPAPGPWHLAVVIDSSASTEPYAKALRVAVIDVARLLSGVAELAVVDAGSQPRVLCGFTPHSADVVAALRQVVPNGGSALWDGLVAALGVAADAPGRRAVLLITDGRHEGGLAELDDVLLLARQGAIPISCIGIGVDVDGAACRRIAAATGGDARFALTADDLPARVGELAHTYGSAHTLAYRSPRPDTDGATRALAWTAADGTEARLLYRAPLPPGQCGKLLVRALGADGSALPVAYRVMGEQGGDPVDAGVAGRQPVLLPPGRFLVEVQGPFGPPEAVEVAAGRSSALVFRLESRLMVHAPPSTRGEPARVAVRDAGTGELVNIGFAETAMDLPPGEYAVDVGEHPRSSHDRVRLRPGRTEALWVANTGVALVRAANAEGKPLAGAVFLQDPTTRQVQSIGRLCEPLAVPAATYLLDIEAPHTGGLPPLVVRPGAVSEASIGALARVTIEYEGAAGMPVPVAFVRALATDRTFALGDVTEFDIGPGEYELALETIPRIEQALTVSAGEWLKFEFRRFGSLTVGGPEGRRFSLRTRPDGDRPGAWLGVFAHNQTVHLVAGEYEILPENALKGTPARPVEVKPLQNTTIALEAPTRPVAPAAEH
ncbi:MAG TPA: vWA domain-containing protein [Armatimonadota bacterium]|nr:vWA domain-containing protein [Armatimonadota bacterium]